MLQDVEALDRINTSIIDIDALLHFLPAFVIGGHYWKQTSSSSVKNQGLVVESRK